MPDLRGREYLLKSLFQGTVHSCLKLDQLKAHGNRKATPCGGAVTVASEKVLGPERVLQRKVGMEGFVPNP